MSEDNRPRVVAEPNGPLQYRIACPHPWCVVKRGQRKGLGQWHYHGKKLGGRSGHCLHAPPGANTSYVLVDSEGNEQ